MNRWWKRVRRPDPVSSGRSLRDILLIFGPATVIAVAGFVVAYQFVKPLPPNRIVMATGPEDGGYHRYGLLYREILARDGIDLELRSSAGTSENADLLLTPDGEVELAFLQGGAGSDGDLAGVQSLGGVFFEPVWIFCRNRPPETVGGLAGKRVAIGEPGSGTRAAVDELFELNGVWTDEVSVVEIGGEAAAQALVDGTVDAACFVSTYHVAFVQRLLAAPGITLMPFQRASAYMRRYRFLSKVVLPRGVLDLRLDHPPQDVPLIAVVANLAARDTVHPALVGLLLAAAEEVHGHGDILAPPGTFPSTLNVILPMNTEARRYLRRGPPFLQRFLPFWIAIGIDRLVVLLIPFATLLYPLFKIVPPTYRWRVRSRIYRHYRDLIEIEAKLHESPTPEERAGYRDRLVAIDGELARLSVPAAHADLLYHLRTHLRFVRERLEEGLVATD